VYAVEAGYGQLLGSLRQDPRVVNLEATNLGELTVELVPDEVDVVTFDLSYLPVSDAAAQLADVRLARDAELVALVKPQFELGLAGPPTDRARLLEAVSKARRGLAEAGWETRRWIESPVRGRRGAVEFLVHGVRCCEVGTDAVGGDS
jgi:23S rRNA (cytidine1920-2'-O)/16S rRNA (cytidine1409-2'-O)-methyltransferase